MLAKSAGTAKFKAEVIFASEEKGGECTRGCLKARFGSFYGCSVDTQKGIHLTMMRHHFGGFYQKQGEPRNT